MCLRGMYADTIDERSKCTCIQPRPAEGTGKSTRVYYPQQLGLGASYCPSSALTPASALKSLRLAPPPDAIGGLNDTEFIFTISNGHTGTKYLAASSTWDAIMAAPPQPEGGPTKANTFPRDHQPTEPTTEEPFSKRRVDISIRHEYFPSAHLIASVPTHPNYCQAAMHYVRETWWPRVLPNLFAGADATPFQKRQSEHATGGEVASSNVDAAVGSPRPAASIRRWVDTGHPVGLSLAPAFHDFLGPHRVRFLRLRRRRSDVAWSKYLTASGSQTVPTMLRGPCSSECVW